MKTFYLSQLGIEPRSLNLQANTLPLRFKGQLLRQGGRNVYLYISRPCDIQPLQFEIRPWISWYRNQGKWDQARYLSTEWSFDRLFTLGAIVVERKYFTCVSRESNPGSWIYRQALYHIAVKAGFYRKAVEVCKYIPRQCNRTIWYFAFPM